RTQPFLQALDVDQLTPDILDLFDDDPPRPDQYKEASLIAEIHDFRGVAPRPVPGHNPKRVAPIGVPDVQFRTLRPSHCTLLSDVNRLWGKRAEKKKEGEQRLPWTVDDYIVLVSKKKHVFHNTFVLYCNLLIICTLF